MPAFVQLKRAERAHGSIPKGGMFAPVRIRRAGRSRFVKFKRQKLALSFMKMQNARDVGNSKDEMPAIPFSSLNPLDRIHASFHIKRPD